MSNHWDEFSRLTTKFLFLNCNDGKNENTRSELNDLLNDLNSFGYQNPKFVDDKTAVRLIESFTNIGTDEETIIVKACYLLTSLLTKQKVQVPVQTFRPVLQWLLRCLNSDIPDVAGDVLKTMHALLKYHPQHLLEFRESLLAPNGPLMKRLTFDESEKKRKNYDGSSQEEIAEAAMRCVEALIPPLDEDLSDHHVELLDAVGVEIIRLFYSQKKNFADSTNPYVFITSGLVALQKIAAGDRDWLERNIGEILGIGKSYMLYGLPGVEQSMPQKVIVSQQSVLEPATSQTNKGGKVPKTRKPRNVGKNRKKDGRSKNSRSEESDRDNHLKVEYDNAMLSPFYKTSESDYSETESGRSQSEMHKQSKLRMAAISLIGVVAKNIEKKIFYGYWHSLFPSESLTNSSKGLLNCVLRDPNPRCRVAALQATSMFLFGSKVYLAQAETRKAPSSFMPFSIALGNMILSIYESLTQALSAESSLPVLTQILKCLGVLIQVTPFHRIDNGFVPSFVKYIRRLIYHKDPTIQVAALMVMEFLISVQDMTNEISECIGIPRSKLKTTNINQNQLNDVGANDVIEPHDEEEVIDSDYEGDVSEVLEENKNCEDSSNKMSWVLQKVLENLGVAVGTLKKTLTLAAAPVRIESLQVLSCLAPHFLLLKDHLELIEIALEKSLSDSQAEIRLYTAKTLDTIGHSMSAYLIEKAAGDTDELSVCVNFWLKILPSVIQKIQGQTQNPALKVSLCDFMSNIGIHIFERLPHTTHIQIISLLSGASCNEENNVKASAVRALAVYALFPSLRDDLCFVENTAESIIPLLKDGNLFVRVKASWAMGNISDALVANCIEPQSERISNDLFKRILEVSSDSAVDNDKVRSNAVRTLGNLLRLLNAEHLRLPAWQLLYRTAIDKLVQNLNSGNNAKVKWNACYAIGNLMKNELLFTSAKDYDWQKVVFSALINVIINNANFKVRINGAAALAVVTRREHYGTHLSTIWSSLLLALEQSNNLVDFNEYKHRDNLQEQICLTLSHVIKICNNEDFVLLKSGLIPALETIKQTWQRVINRVLPENAAPLLSCSLYLNEILQRPNLPSETKNSLQVLASCFVSPSNEYF